MTKAELIAELRGIVTGGSAFSDDLEVASAAVGAGRAVYFRVTGSRDLPDLDAIRAASRGVKDQVPGQPEPSDNGNDDAA